MEKENVNEEKNDANVEDIKLEKKRYFQLPWGNVGVGTPYLAKITGLDQKYTFKREFIKPEVVDRKTATYLIDARKLEIGAVYERRSPQSWKHSDERYFFVVRKTDMENGELTIEYLEKKDVIIEFNETSGEVIKNE